MRLARVCGAGLGMAIWGAVALAAPPTDAEIDGLIDRVRAIADEIEDPAERVKAQQEYVREKVGDVSWAEVTAAQFDRLAAKGLMLPYAEVREKSFARLKELAAEPTVEGARCADILIACWPRATDMNAAREEEERKCAAVVSALKHPKMGELIEMGKGVNVLRAVPMFRPDLVREHGLVALTEPYITTNLKPLGASALWSYLDLLTEKDYGGQPGDTKRIVGKIGDAAAAAAKKDDPLLKDDSATAERTKKNLETLAETCRSAWARGELLNHEAPEIEFTWSNSPSPIRSFADFKGKVVLVDFWATWCGPCVASFPEVRALAERYKDYPVAIVSVTSLQGYHIARTQGEGAKIERIDCKDDPEKERSLLRDFIRDMDMTWTVAFSDKSCFNPDFGVRGIPHIAILTPDGKVRFNGLRPGSIEADAARIDALLREFGLPCPAPMGDEKKRAEEHAEEK